MRYRELDGELNAWVAEGLVSAEQAEAIRSRARDRAPAAARTQVVRALSVAGAVVVGLGIVLFVAANWDALPRPTRVVMLLATLLGAYAAGFELRERRGTHRALGEALYLVGGLAFAASLFLVGQMYHVDAHMPLAFLAIALGTGAVAAITVSPPLASLSLLALGGWPLAEFGDARGGDAFEYWPVAAALYGAALYGLATADRGLLERAGFRAPMRAIGLPALALGLFVFTFAGVFGELSERPGLGGLETGALVALVLAAAVGALALSLRAGARPTAPYEGAALAVATVLVPLALLVPETAGYDHQALVYPLLFNLLLAVVALGAIVVGYVNGEEWLVNVGVVAVGIDVVARYFDFFWDFLPRSLTFVGAGVLLLALAWLLERQRSRLVEKLR